MTIKLHTYIIIQIQLHIHHRLILIFCTIDVIIVCCYTLDLHCVFLENYAKYNFLFRNERKRQLQNHLKNN